MGRVSLIREQSKLEKVISSVLERTSSVSQRDYFNAVAPLIGRAKSSLIIAGYDQPFLEDEFVQRILKSLTYDGIRIEAVILEEQRCWLSEGTPENVTVYRHPHRIVSGFTIIDGVHTLLWDSTRKTAYPPEISQNVYWRYCLAYNPSLAEKYTKHFHQLVEQLYPKTKP